MRYSMIAFVLVAMLVAGSAFARRIAWKHADEPPVPLQKALDLAKGELKDEGYFCVEASIAKTYTQGDWELHFCTKQGKDMWVSVGSDQSVRKSESGFEY